MNKKFNNIEVHLKYILNELKELKEVKITVIKLDQIMSNHMLDDNLEFKNIDEKQNETIDLLKNINGRVKNIEKFKNMLIGIGFAFSCIGAIIIVTYTFYQFINELF